MAMKEKRFVRTAVTAMSIAFPSMANAGPPVDAPALAAQLFTEAEQARQAKDFATCIAKTEQAYATYPQAQIRGLQGTCEAALDRFVDAATHLAFFFENSTDAAPDDFVKAFARAQARTTRLTIACQPEGVEISIDGKQRGKAPQTIYVEPGDRVVVATKDGLGRKEERKTLIAGTKLGLSFDLRPTESPKPSSDELPAWPTIVGFSVAGVGLALGGAMSVAYGVRRGEARDIASTCDGRAAYARCDVDGQAAADEADTFGTIGIAGFAVGGAALVFAIPYAVVAGASETESVGFQPVIAPEMVGGVVTGRF